MDILAGCCDHTSYASKNSNSCFRIYRERRNAKSVNASPVCSVFLPPGQFLVVLFLSILCMASSMCFHKRNSHVLYMYGVIFEGKSIAAQRAKGNSSKSWLPSSQWQRICSTGTISEVIKKRANLQKVQFKFELWFIKYFDIARIDIKRDIRYILYII